MQDDLINKRINNITVLSLFGKDRHNKIVYQCLCDCGHIFNVRKSVLRLNRIKSCRNCKRPKDLTGLVSGELKVVEFDKMGKYGNLWKCQCSCGNIVSLYTNTFLSKNTRSCGRCGAFLGNKSAGWKGFGEISSHYFTQLKHNAKIRDIEFNVSVEYLWQLFLEQNRQCVFTNRILTFAQSYRKDCKKHQTASLDRIDCKLGYIEGNLQWVHKDINMMKRRMSNDEFINTCILVANTVHGK